jgi:tRNA pseudouridine55 synthase
MFKLVLMLYYLPTVQMSSNIIVPSGLLAVHKPKNWSSSDVVAKVRWILSEGARVELRKIRKPKIKVGHGGTLDPLAEGVLVLGVGEGTKLLESYLSGPKSYTAEILLGSETDTLDRTGNGGYIITGRHVVTNN